MNVTMILFGGPCAGNYEAESRWPPPDTIRAVHDGSGGPAVLDLPDAPHFGTEVVEYEISSWGYTCRRGRSARDAFATYYRVGFLPWRRAAVTGELAGERAA